MKNLVVLEQVLDKYGQKEEKTGWTFIKISAAVAQQLKPHTKKSFRIMGYIDQLQIKQLALIPSGDGGFILPINATVRKQIGKESGGKVLLKIEEDNSTLENSADLLTCLEDEPSAEVYFKTLTQGHQRYFSNWIEDAKTIETKTKRLSQSLYALANDMDYGQMIRFFKKKKDENTL